MPSSTVQVKITGKSAGSTLNIPLLNLAGVAIANAFRNIGAWFESVGIGARTFNGFVQSGGALASGTITISSMIANDTVTVNGVVLTCSSTLQDATHFKLGANDTATAANLATCINAAAATVSNNLAATSAANVVTVTCKESGTIGNLCTLAISAHGSVSGANLTGGTDANVVPLAKGI